MLALLALFACAPRLAPPAPAVVAAVDVAVSTPSPDAVPDVTAVVLAPALTPEGMAAATPLPADARQLVNAWRERHNAGVARLQAGDAAGALVEARAAVELAPPELRDEPLVLVAVAASQAGEGVIEIEALARVGDGADVHWGVYYNGGVDAVTAGRPDLAHRFAQAALARGGDIVQVAPLAVRAALRVQAFDAALAAGALLPAEHPTRADLVRALIVAGRCPDAERLAPGACG